MRKRITLMGVLLMVGAVCVSAEAGPDHPIITEVFNNPPGSDGPSARDLLNDHQEFIEIYLPPAVDLDPGLNADALRLAFYEIEGDSANTERGFVSQRYDLPPFDLDPTNGLTPGTLARPASGVVVLGWVDYAEGLEPIDLLGTPSTRVGLINGGITTSPAGALFIAINGSQFGGTTNFPVVEAESLIEVPDENVGGVMANGSNVYLLVNRDDAQYAQLVDRSLGGSSFADLAGGTVLGLSALLDGIAGNDDSDFITSQQPYPSPSGFDIDLEDVLPLGGVFSPWVAQISEASGGGYLRRFVDSVRTTEDGSIGNESPSFDASTHFGQVYRSGPFYPTPGEVRFLADPPELGVSDPTRLDFQVIAGTTGRPGLLCANVGGDFPIEISAVPGSSSDPSSANFSGGPAAIDVPGMSEALPQIEVTAPANAAHLAIVTVPVTFSATNTFGEDPPVFASPQTSTATATVLNPTSGVDELGAQKGTTVFLAARGFGADPNVANEFLGSDLANFITSNLGGLAAGTTGNLAVLLNPGADLENIAVADPLRQSFPQGDVEFIGAPAGSGGSDLAGTLLNSAKVASGSSAYSASVSFDQARLKAIRFNIAETGTSGGTFATSAELFFADPIGVVNDSARSGLNSATTARTFELAILDTNATFTGIESGDADDFGLIVRAGQVRAGASAAPGELIFLSFTGGLEGEDIDTIDVPGIHASVAVLLDLDNLDTVLGVETITELFVIDSGLTGTFNVMDVVSLNALPCSNCGGGGPAPDPDPEGPPAGLACDGGIADGLLCSVCNGGPRDGLLCQDIEDCFGSSCVGNDALCPPDGTCSEQAPWQKSRFVSFTLPEPPTAPLAIRVTLESVNGNSALNGQARWAAAPSAYPEGDASTPLQGNWNGAGLTCGPVFADWSALVGAPVHLFGDEIVPGSKYRIETVSEACDPLGEDPSCFSKPLFVRTAAWTDITSPMFGTTTVPQPDLLDILAAVDKFLGVPSAPTKPRTLLFPEVPRVHEKVDLTEVLGIVDAFLGASYPLQHASPTECN